MPLGALGSTVTYSNTSAAIMPILGTVTASGTVATSNPYASTSAVWRVWNTSTATNTTTVIWDGWHQAQYLQQQQMAQYQQYQNTVPNFPVELSEEEREGRRLAQEQLNARYAEIQAQQAAVETARRAEQEKAIARARELLEGHLSEKQLATLREHNWFIVQGGKTKKRYAISCTGWTGNVYELDKANRAVRRMCCHANDNVPCWDHYLSQKLWLQYAEADFLKAANFSDPSPQQLTFAEAA